jgi:polyisoprenoid-binding protein YceI
MTALPVNPTRIDVNEGHFMTITADSIPGYKAGTWTIDASHSSVGFSVRHLMISKVKGTFDNFSGSFETGENPLDTKVTASAAVSSINTGDENRDGHLRTNEFFDAEKFPTIDFVSTGVKVKDAAEGEYTVDGNLTLRGVTKPVEFDFEFGGFALDPYGNYKAAATATGVINRDDFGLTWNAALETGGVVVGDKVTITIDFQAVLAA